MLEREIVRSDENPKTKYYKNKVHNKRYIMYTIYYLYILYYTIRSSKKVNHRVRDAMLSVVIESLKRTSIIIRQRAVGL